MDELDIRKDELDEQEKQEKTLLEKVAQLVLANTTKLPKSFLLVLQGCSFFRTVLSFI